MWSKIKELNLNIIYLALGFFISHFAYKMTDGNFTYKMYKQERLNQILFDKNEIQSILDFDPNK